MILEYLKGYKRNLTFGFISGILSSIMLSYIPTIYSKIVQHLVNDNDNSNGNSNDNSNENLNKYLILYLFYNISSNIFAGIRGTIFTINIELVINKIKEKILNLYFSKDLIYYNNKKLNEVSDILITDARLVGDIYLLNSNVFVRNLTQFITISYILIPASFILYLITLSLTIMHIIIEKIYMHYIYEKISNETNEISIKQNNMITEYINKIETYRSLYLEPALKNKWNEINNKYLNLKKKDAICYGVNLLIIQTLNEIMKIIIIVFGNYFNYSNNIILIFILYKSYFTGIIKEINEMKRNIIRNKKSIVNITDFINDNDNGNGNGNDNGNDNDNDNDNDNGNDNGYYVPSYNFNPNIEIRNLTFSYDNKTDVISNLNLTILSNQIIGFKGKSGNGKSTLFKLLLGFYKSQIKQGEILFDDINIHHIDKTYFYEKLISFVGQEPVLLEGSIRNNIINNVTIFDPYLYNLILPLISDFYDNDNDNGNDNDNDNDNIKLSGGQKQRVCICRALMRKPKILLLDEPTSALDNENINKFIDVIKKISNEYKTTILIISHDDELLSICNNIINI
jgi:ABC-type branched-subunit amino acid transport system ATPase component